MGTKAKRMKKIIKILTFTVSLIIIGCQTTENKIHDYISAELKEDKSIIKFEIIEENSLHKLILTSSHLDIQNLDENMNEKINIFYNAYRTTLNSIDTNTKFKVIFMNNNKKYESKEYNLFDFE